MHFRPGSCGLTEFVAGSTTEIVFASMFGTQSAPSTQALASGFAPTATDPTTFRLTGSSRNTRPRSLETQSAPPPGVIQSAAGTAIRFVTRFVRGSIRVTRPRARSLTQTAPFAYTSPFGSEKPRIRFTTRFRLGLTRTTVPSLSSETHTLPAPNAAANARNPTGTCRTILSVRGFTRASRVAVLARDPDAAGAGSEAVRAVAERALAGDTGRLRVDPDESVEGEVGRPEGPEGGDEDASARADGDPGRRIRARGRPAGDEERESQHDHRPAHTIAS